MNPIPKKPKVEHGVDEEDVEGVEEHEEEEEALVALIEHRKKEVEHLSKRLSYYTNQLEETKKSLNDSQSKLNHLKRKRDSGESEAAIGGGMGKAKVGAGFRSSPHASVGQSPFQNGTRPQLLIPALSTKVGQTRKLSESSMKVSVGSQMGTLTGPTDVDAAVQGEVSGRLSYDQKNDKLLRSCVKKEHRDLVPVIRSCSSPFIIRIQPSMNVASQHKRKLRSLALNPVVDELFVTSALDGVVKLWEVQSKGASVSLLSSTDSVSPNRRWPEDITWHPSGDSLFAAYTADDGDSQISILNLNASKEKRLTFLEEKPHHKGIINGIKFMPWSTVCFVTGGSDHAVILWNEKDRGNVWKPKLLHRYTHSSAVMGVAGMHQKNVVMSSGADKRIIGYDVDGGKVDVKLQVDSKCMEVLPNPSDFNLFMVQTAAPEKQLRLFDIRVRQEIHAFGWKQETSDSQSALIAQAWSPDGFYLSSGSTDPMIHIFDIRYNARIPSQSVRAHQKRVFKAVWHHRFPVLISISSDLQIGLHKINSP